MPASEKKLFLLDAYALIYRAYYSFINNPRINSKGMNTSATLGFTNTLIEVIRKENPTHIAVVFDMPGPSDREAIYPEYKANRETMPEDIANNIPFVKKVIEAFNIPIYELPGYEADDLIGTLAKLAEKSGFQTYMMTPDKDFGQLVSENIFMYKPARSGNPPEILGVPEVCAKFEIETPAQLIDILGLWGDAVDNIPGVPGVGEKTAKKLIAQFGSIEELVKNTDQLKGKLKENVDNNVEQALMSKQLATILLDSPIQLEEEALKIVDPNKDALSELFAELEFRQLAQRFLGSTPVSNGKPKSEKKSMAGIQVSLFDVLDDEAATPTTQLNTADNTKHNYKVVKTAADLEKLNGQLNKQKEFCFDTETTGLDPLTAELVGIAFSWKAGEAFYVPIPEDFDEARKAVQLFKGVLEDDKAVKVGQNLKYDILVLKKYGIDVGNNLFDTMIAHYLLRPDMRHNMDLLAETYLNYTPIAIETLIGKKGKNQKSIREADLDLVGEYAAEDADITLQLKEVFEPMLAEEKCADLFNDIEIPLVGVLADMECEGIALDTKALSSFSKELEKDILKLQAQIYKLAGVEFNIDSPKQLGDVLFEHLKVSDKPKKTKTGQYATSEDILAKMVNDHAIIPEILDYRSIRKLKSTYVDSLPNMVNNKTKHVHTNYRQAVAATGRLSSDNPNLQNIPIRTQRGKEVRKAFIPRNSDFTLLSADYSQIELRIIAELSKDKNMIDAFVSGEDIHSSTAAKIFGVPLKEVTRELRGRAKAVNFGISYGQTAFGLSQNLNIPRSEAKEIITSFFTLYADVKSFMDAGVEFAKENGYVETIMGRRRYLRDINSSNAIVRGHAERNAINAPIQGSAADMIKIAMINIQREMKKAKMQSKMLLQVHDELIFDALKAELDELRPLVQEHMKNAIKMQVPIVVEIGEGENWLEAH
ncbi:MAG TPA: DNA polymerase I [Flavobacteriales bacterium]|nr:DNA polymerase I [Flavobacteriales bacterium]HIO68890.1 DNA polymerase I [Flavobacteriales bacterium]